MAVPSMDLQSCRGLVLEKLTLAARESYNHGVVYLNYRTQGVMG